MITGYLNNMSKPTSYELLKDTYNAVNRLEDKMDNRFILAEGRLDKVEAQTENMLGKIGVGVIVVSAVISSAVIAIWSWFKSKFS